MLWNKIFKKDLIKKHDIDFPDGCEFDDDSFVNQYIAFSSNYFAVDENLYNYYIRSGSVMALLDHNSKFKESVMSIRHTVKKFTREDQIFNKIFINDFITKKINWFLPCLKTRNKIRFIDLLIKEVFKELDSELIM